MVKRTRPKRNRSIRDVNNDDEDQFNGKEIESENVLNMVHEPRQIRNINN